MPAIYPLILKIIGFQTLAFFSLFGFALEEPWNILIFSTGILSLLFSFRQSILLFFAFRTFLHSQDGILSGIYRLSEGDFGIRFIQNELLELDKLSDALNIAVERLSSRIVESLKNAQIAKQSIEQMNLFIHNTEEIFAIFDPQLRYRFASKKWVNFFELDKKVYIGHKHIELIKNDNTFFHLIQNSCLHKNVIGSQSDILKISSEREHQISWKASPILHSDHLDGVFVQIKILDQEVSYQKQILALEDRLAFSFEKNPLPMIEICCDSIREILEKWNPAKEFNETLKIYLKEIRILDINLSFSRLLSSETKPLFQEIFEVQMLLELLKLFSCKEQIPEKSFKTEVQTKQGKQFFYVYSTCENLKRNSKILTLIPQKTYVHLQAWEQTFSHSTILAWACDQNGMILYASDGFKKILGQKEIEGTLIRDLFLFSTEAETILKRNKEIFLQKRGDFTIWEEIHNLSGDRFVLATNRFLIPHLEDNSIVLAISTDITAHVETLCLLENTKDRYELFLENSIHPIFIVRNGTILYCNHAFSKVLGFESSDLVCGNPLESFVLPEYRHLFHNGIELKNSPIQMVSQKNDILDFYAQSFSTNLMLKPALMVMLTDVSVWKQEVLKIEKEKEMIQKNLRNEEKKLALAKNQIQKILALIREELQSPLKKIEGLVQMIDEDYGKMMDKEGTHFLSRLKSGCASMSKVLETLSKEEKTD